VLLVFKEFVLFSEKLDRANAKACSNSAPATHREPERIAFVQSAALTWLSSAANEVEGNHPVEFVRANFSRRFALARSNDPSSATRPRGGHDCNRDAQAGFAAAHG
jgi:hypothetical protein